MHPQILPLLESSTAPQHQEEHAQSALFCFPCVCGWGQALRGLGLDGQHQSQVLPIHGLSVTQKSHPQDPDQESSPIQSRGVSAPASYHINASV